MQKIRKENNLGSNLKQIVYANKPIQQIEILNISSESDSDQQIEQINQIEQRKNKEIDLLKQIGLIQTTSKNNQSLPNISFIKDIKQKSQLKKLINQIQQQNKDLYQHIHSLQKNNQYLVGLQMQKTQILILQSHKSIIRTLIKNILLLKQYISLFCRKVSSHYLFQTFNLLIIIVNSLVMAVSDPLATQQTYYQSVFQIIFLTSYIIEMLIFVIGYGLIIDQNSYLRNPWNILNFIIIIANTLPFFFTLGFSVNAIKVIRVLRPLRTITKVNALKMIIKTLFQSFSLVLHSIIILVFVIILFSVLGLQLFSGCLKQRCINIQTGISVNYLCINNQNCQRYGSMYRCAKTIASPNFSIQNFDTIGWAFITVFQTITLEGWSTIMIDLQNSSNYWAFLYSVSIVFICEMILLNITLAILKYKFSLNRQQKEQKRQDYQDKQIPITILKKLGIYSGLKRLKQQPVDLRNIVGKSSKEIELIKNKSLGLKRKKISKLKQMKFNQNISVMQKQQKQIEKRSNLSQDVESDNDSNKQLSDFNLIKIKQYPLNGIIIKSSTLKNSQSNQSSVIQSNQINTQRLISSPTKLIIQDQKKIAIQRNNFLLSLTQKQNYNKKQQQVQTIGFQKVEFDLIPNEKFFDDLKQLNVPRKRLQKQRIEILNKDLKLRNRREKISKKKSFKQIMKIEKDNSIQEMKLLNELKNKQIKLEIKKIQSNEYQQKLFTVLQSRKSISLQNSIQIKNKPKFIYQFFQSSLYQKFILENTFQQKIPQIKNQHHRIRNKIQCEPYSQKLQSGRSIANNNGFKIKFNNKNLKKHEKQSNLKKLDLIQTNKIYFEIFQTEYMNKQKKVSEYKVKQQKSQKLSYKFQKIIKNQNTTNAKIYQNLLQNYQNSTIIMNYPAHQIYPFKQLDISISIPNYDIWIPGIIGLFTIIKSKIKLILLNPTYDYFVLFVVLLNTIVLSLNGLIDTSSFKVDYLSIINYIFTIFFSVDIVLKLIAYDFYFFQDFLNIFDFIVVTISLIELQISSKVSSDISAFRSVRIFRIFRVLRVARLLRSMKFMQIITSVIYNVLAQFIYIFLFLGLFVFIYILLGMQIFGGTFLPIKVSNIRQNFDNFINASMSVFQVLTIENWNDIQTQILYSDNSKFTIIYLISWIFIGNWVLLNLLQAVLLDGFENNPQQQKQDHQDIDDLNNQQLTKLFNYNSTLKLTNKQETENDKIITQVDYSCFFFASDGILRKSCINIMNSIYFEICVYLAILFSCSILIYQTYVFNDNIKQQIFVTNMNNIVTLLFLLQFAIMIISKGFIFTQNSYISNNWNRLDLLIIIISILDIFVSADLSFIKILRAIRPIRLISKNIKIKILIVSLIQSMNGVFHVLVVLLLVFVMFGILFINLLQGKLNYCDQDQGMTYGPYNINEIQCQQNGFVWRTQLINFQNIQSALISLYVFSTRQNWPFYYYTFVDATQNGPILNNNQSLFLILSIIFICVCSYFLIDLFIGVLFLNFHLAQKRINPKKISQKQQNWIELQKLILNSDPLLILYTQPNSSIRKIIFKVVHTKLFEFIFGVISIINIIVLMLYQDDDLRQIIRIFQILNYVFCSLFSIEFILKIITYSIRGYFMSIWNVLDAIVLFISYADIFINYQQINILIHLGKLFRVLRILRLIKLFKRYKNLEKLLQTVVCTLPPAANAIALLGIFLFVFSIIASFLFNDIKSDVYQFYDQNHNFSDFTHSIQLLFICLTGQNWYIYMFGSINSSTICISGDSCTSSYNIIFWLPFIFVGQKIMMELFVLVVLDQFQKTYIQQNNPLGMFINLEQDFRQKWLRFSKKSDNKYIQPHLVISLYLHVKSPIGIGIQQGLQQLSRQLDKSILNEQEKQKKIFNFVSKMKQLSMKWIMKMNLPNQDLNYYEIFYKFTKQALTSEFQNMTEQQSIIVEAQQQKSQKKIFSQFKKNKINSSQYVNPLLRQFFAQITLKTWARYTQNKLMKQQQQQNEDSILNSMIDQDKTIELTQQLQKHQRIIQNRRKTRISKRVQKQCEQNELLPNTQIYGNEHLFKY